MLDLTEKPRRRKGKRNVEDEVYFFAKYYLTRREFEKNAQYHFDIVSNQEEIEDLPVTSESVIENAKEFLNTSDDSCFLCKDGGALMECDCCWYDVKTTLLKSSYILPKWYVVFCAIRFIKYLPYLYARPGIKVLSIQRRHTTAYLVCFSLLH